MTTENVENAAPEAPVKDSLDEKIVTQLEYYFGNINLPRDKFLQEKIKLEEGWVPISVLLSFNRLKSLCEDVERIATAVAALPSDIISLSEDKTKIRRNVHNAVPENSLEYWQTIKHRTVYMKGFPEETTLDEIMKFAAQFGHPENVLMRRTKPDRKFKGSVFVTYKTNEEAQEAQKKDDKFGDIELVKIMQNDYWQQKNTETKAARAKEKAAKAAKKQEELAEKKKAKPAHYVKGQIMALSGLPEGTTYQQIKEALAPFGTPGYVVAEAGQTTAQVRFQGDENAAKIALEKATADDAKLKIRRTEIEARVLEGEEEDKYWTDFNADKEKRFESSNRGGGRGGRGGNRGGRGGRGRGVRGGPRGSEDRKRKLANELREGGGGAPKRIVFNDDDE